MHSKQYDTAIREKKKKKKKEKKKGEEYGEEGGKTDRKTDGKTDKERQTDKEGYDCLTNCLKPVLSKTGMYILAPTTILYACCSCVIHLSIKTRFSL